MKETAVYVVKGLLLVATNDDTATLAAGGEIHNVSNFEDVLMYRATEYSTGLIRVNDCR